jgi:hypothetical protein
LPKAGKKSEDWKRTNGVAGFAVPAVAAKPLKKDPDLVM